MDLGTLRDLFRLRVDDTRTPYLWSDDEIDSFANSAVREACIRARLIVDSTTAAVCEIDVVAATASYSTSPLILTIEDARLEGADRSLSKIDHTRIDYINAQNYAEPRAFTQDSGANVITLFPTPTANTTLYLTVTRLPLIDMTQDTHTPEIPVMWHERLLDWMCHLAYLKQDADAADMKRADLFAQRFATWFGAPLSARWIETQRAHSAPSVQCSPIY